MRLRNGITLMLIAVLFASMASVPAAAQLQVAQLSFVWFAHVGTDAPAVDIYFADNPTTPIVTDLSFGDVTQMYAFPSNKRGLIMRKAGSTADDEPAIFESNWLLTPNQSYLMLATGLLFKNAFVLDPITLVRNNIQGRSRLRIINVISNSPPLRMLDGTGATLATNLLYLRTVDVNRNPGPSELDLQNRLGETITTEKMEYKADTLYVALITGDAIDTFPIDVQILEFPQETTRVKVVNDSDTPYNVVLKRGGTQTIFAPDLAPKASSDYIEVPSGAASFLIKRSASDDTREIIASALQLRPSRDVTLTIVGTGMNIEVVLSSQTLAEGVPIAGQPAGETATPDATP
jgi:hypothetical protein